MVMKSINAYKHLRVFLYYIILLLYAQYASYMIQPHLPSSERCITKYILQKRLQPMVQEVV